MAAPVSNSRPSFLLVDGNNVLHAWPELSRIHQRGRGSAHGELIRRMSDFHSFTGKRVVVVFDGRNQARSEERLPEGIQVFYSSASETADDLIERLALKYLPEYHITVATNDRAEQDMVIGAGGEVLTVDQLRDEWERAERERERWLDRHRNA